jgi:glycosyltransferase involved in cell wall biosynthesis
MHVVLCSPTWPLKKHPNGIVTYVHWMRDGLQQAGHRVSIVSEGGAEAGPGIYPVRPSPMRRARTWLRTRGGPVIDHSLVWSAALADQLKTVHRTQPIDVFEMEESFGWAEDVARRTSIPTVVRLHGPAFMSLVEEELDTPFANAKIEREGQALRGLPVITSPARHTLEQTIARYGLAPKIGRHVVNPLALPESAPLWQLDACDRKTLLFVGRFDQRKGGDTVLKAFALLLAANPGLRLVFVGPDAGVPGPQGTLRLFSDLKAELFHGLDAERVVFRGKLPPEEIYALRAQAFVTLVASRWENQSYTTLEAMLQGCPIVATNAGGQPEIILDGDTGLLAAVDDPADLCAKVQSLLDDPQRAATLGHRARQHALEHHAPALIVAQTLEVYRQAIAIAQGARV